MRLLAIAFFLVPAIASAQTTEMQSAKALGMGGAFRGFAWDNSAIDLNPAGLSQLSRFAFEGGYLRGEETEDYALNASFVDALTNRVATGFAVEYQKRRPVLTDPGIDQQKWIGAVGIPIVPESIYLGFSSKMIIVKYPGAAVAPEDKTIVTGDFGLLWRPIQIASVGATFDNLVNGGHHEAPRSVTLGGGILATRWLAVSADVFVDFESDDKDQTGWAVGVQVTPHRNLSVRAGMFEHPLTHDRTWTAGLGLQGESGAIDYSVRIATEDPDSNDPNFDEILTHYLTVSVMSF